MMTSDNSSDPPWVVRLYPMRLLNKETPRIRLMRIHPGQSGHVPEVSALRGQNFSPERMRTLLLARSKQCEDPIKCTLITTVLKYAEEFEALSYAWGDPADRSQIHVNGIKMPVTRNLESAIRRLRRPDRERTIWADAVCINQYDFAERTAQVRIMGTIYGSASQVVVWLGECDGDEGTAVRWLQSGTVECSPPLIKSALLQLLGKPWWTRVWVVQEIASAKCDPLLICGEHSLSWSKLDGLRVLKTVRTILMGLRDKSAGLLECVEPIELENLRALMGIRDRVRFHPELREINGFDNTEEIPTDDLLYLLSMTRRFDASDPRDKVFALWTMARGIDNSRHLAPDYKKPMEQMCTEVAWAVIRYTKSLKFLQWRWAEPHKAMASWVPDFSIDGPHFPMAPELMDRYSQFTAGVACEIAHTTRSSSTESVWAELDANLPWADPHRDLPLRVPDLSIDVPELLLPPSPTRLRRGTSRTSVRCLIDMFSGSPKLVATGSSMDKISDAFRLESLILSYCSSVRAKTQDGKDGQERVGSGADSRGFNIRSDEEYRPESLPYQLQRVYETQNLMDPRENKNSHESLIKESIFESPELRKRYEDAVRVFFSMLREFNWCRGPIAQAAHASIGQIKDLLVIANVVSAVQHIIRSPGADIYPSSAAHTVQSWLSRDHNNWRFSEDPVAISDVRAYLEIVLAAALGSELVVFETYNGRIGIGPACIREEDVLAVLDDAPVVNILRNKTTPDGSKEQWQLFGNAYLHFDRKNDPVLREDFSFPTETFIIV